jgi:hypothetical protein
MLDRSRRLVLAFGVAVLAALVGIAAAPTPAFAWDQPKPVTSPFPTPTTTTGTKPGSQLCRGGAVDAVGCFVLVGGAAYEGTCWLLGQIFSDPDGCDEGVDTLISYIPGLGDVDESLYSGPAGIINPSGYTGALHTANVTVFGVSTGGQIRVEIRYKNSATGAFCTTTLGRNWDETAYPLTLPPALGHNGITAKQTLDQNGFFSTSGPASCNGTSVGSSYLYDIKVIASNSSNATLETLATWTADPGYGTPYEMTYERHCAGGAAGSGQTISGTETFTPIPGIPSPGVSLPTCQSVYPGSHEVDLELGGDRQGITNPSPAVGVSVGGFTPEQQADYPLCASGDLAGACYLDLLRDGKSCFSGTVYCAGWQTNVVRWNMTCEWGPYLMAIELCEAKYGTKFDAQPKPNPQPSPTAPPTTGTPPTTGPNPETPPTDPGAGTDPDGRSCYADAWSWNPVDWVYVPVKCVFIWAFVPDTAVLQGLITDVKDAWSDSTIGNWLGAFGGITPPTAAGGCAGPTVEFPVKGSEFSAQPLWACSGARATMAAVASGITSAGMVVFGGLGCLRALGSGFGWSPKIGGRE